MWFYYKQKIDRIKIPTGSGRNRKPTGLDSGDTTESDIARNRKATKSILSGNTGTAESPDAWIGGITKRRTYAESRGMEAWTGRH